MNQSAIDKFLYGNQRPQSAATADDTYLDDPTIAEILGVAPDTLRRMRARGDFPPADWMAGGRYHRTLRSTLAAWQAEQRARCREAAKGAA
jgi:hypothetical protein